MMNIISIRPAYDNESRLLHSFFEEINIEIKDSSKLNHINHFDLEYNSANVSNLMQTLSTLPAKESNIICFYGHGAENCLIGWDMIPIIDINNISKMLGWHFYTVACNSVKKLGLTAVTNGILSYIGYNDNFIIGREREVVIKGLKESVNKGILSSVQSLCYNIEVVFNNILKEFDFWIEYHSNIIEHAYNAARNGTFDTIVRELHNIDSSPFAKFVLMYNQQKLERLS